MDSKRTLDIVAVARRIEATGRWRRRLRVATGAGVVAVGVVQGGVLGSAVALGGLALLVRAVTRRPLRESVKRLVNRLNETTTERFGGGQRDSVDEASWESFPASDPPAHAPSAHPSFGRSESEATPLG